jgi:hypothetical protein
MHTALIRPLRLAFWLALPLSAGAQAPATPELPPTQQAAPEQPAPAAPDACRPLTDKAMAADMKALTAQSQKLELSEQARLFEESVVLWTQAGAQCEGRAKDRAQRNLANSQKTSNSLTEQLGAGPQCSAAHKDASALQDIARQALGERRWTDAAMLFHKAEDMWEMAAERCSGSQQESANRRREQSEIDGQNAEFCAPLFEKAREHTQKLRASAAGLSREAKQDASMVAETLWRDAVGQCKGTTVQDTARNNAQALARERGTPWVARVAPAAAPVRASIPLASHSAAAVPSNTLAQTSGTGTSVIGALGAAFSALGSSASPVAAPAQAKAPESAPVDISTDTTRFSGQFVRDPEGATYSGTGKVAWATGDVFEGTLVKGLRHGKGVITWANGQRYKGDWVNDKPSGQAEMQFANGNQFEGSVSDGVPQGQGRMRYASGDSYVGQLNAGVPEGHGAYIWKNGQQFEGDWKAGRPNGHGKLKFATGNQFEGQVRDGVPHGQGRLVFAAGEVYVGQLSLGQPEGQGSFTWPNGDQYSGQWKAGKKHGQGVFTWRSGERWEGLYDNDVQSNADTLARKN